LRDMFQARRGSFLGMPITSKTCFLYRC